MKLLNRSSGTGQHRQSESGQVNIFMILALGIFFLAFLGFAVDFANFWFHRRASQAAADAACQAGAMDLLVNATNNTNLGGLGSPPADFDCATSGNSTSAPCQYALLNGYSSATLDGKTPGTDVKVKFPATVDGVVAPPGSLAPTPFIQVNVEDDVQTFFSGLLTGKSVQPVGASAVCALQLAKAPIPIIVLNPTCQHSFEVSGSATLQVVGGPTKSVEVNSGNQTCASATDSSSNGCGGNGTIDLSHGGPNFTGSSFGSFGLPLSAPKNFKGGTTGFWQSPSTPIPDPFANLSKPDVPNTTRTGPIPVNFHDDGCPDNKGCDEYLPGKYTSPIVVKGRTAIFVPGVYYIKPTSYTGATATCGSPGGGCSTAPKGQCNYDFLVDAGGIVRPAGTLTTGVTSDGSLGVIIYTSGPGGTGSGSYGGVSFTSSAGSGGTSAKTCPATGTRCVESMARTALTCDGSDPDPKGTLGIPSLVDGDIILGQCTLSGTYVGSPSTDTTPVDLTKANRGIIFFQDRADADPNGQNNMQGGGGLAISGTIYVHNCPSSPNCSAPPSDYNAFLSLQGNPGSGTFVIGEIITDQLVEAGNGTVAMQLNPKAVFFILKAELVK